MANPKTRLFSDILLELDLDKVQKEIEDIEAGQPNMPEYEKQDVRELVLVAAQRWLPQDLEEWNVTDVEIPFQSHEGPIVPAFRGITDIRGRHRGRFDVFKERAGQSFICDWKTTQNKLDADWADRYKYSWQWKLYCFAFPDTQLFSYRGVNRSGETREIIIDIPPGVVDEAREYLKQIQQMRLSLGDRTPWPRKMPGSCKAYGRECDFWDLCRTNTVLDGYVDFGKPLSYSGCETFLLCPEKHRLTQIGGYGEDDDTLAFGKAFHRGIAEIYKQAFKL